MHESHAFFLLNLQSAIVGIVVNARYEANLCAVAASSFHLRDRSASREADNRLDATFSSSQSHTLGMVASRASYHAACFLVVAELRNHITCATHLKRTGDLQVLWLDENVAVFANCRRSNEVGVSDDAFQHL